MPSWLRKRLRIKPVDRADEIREVVAERVHVVEHGRVLELEAEPRVGPEGIQEAVVKNEVSDIGDRGLDHILGRGQRIVHDQGIIRGQGIVRGLEIGLSRVQKDAIRSAILIERALGRIQDLDPDPMTRRNHPGETVPGQDLVLAQHRTKNLQDQVDLAVQGPTQVIQRVARVHHLGVTRQGVHRPHHIRNQKKNQKNPSGRNKKKKTLPQGNSAALFLF